MKIVLIVAAVGLALAAAFVRPPRVAAVPPSEAGFSSAPPVHHGALAPTTDIVVYVAGEVRAPGVVALRGGARIVDALARAGGAKPDADLIAVNLAALLRDGDEIVVPVRGAPLVTAPHARRASTTCAPRNASPRARRGGRSAHAAVAAEPPAQPVDVNHADAESLATLPGIGRALAQRIVAYRETFGPFASADDLLDVAGITERRLADIAPSIVVRP